MNKVYVAAAIGVGVVSAIGLWIHFHHKHNNKNKDKGILTSHGDTTDLVQQLSQSNSKTLEDMVEQLKKLKIITEKSVEAAMLRVDRAKYIPPSDVNPYKETAAPLGFNATISAPHMHAIGLSILAEKLYNGACVLDVGSGSGYVSACLAAMVAPLGQVYGVEHVPELVESSIENITKANNDLLPFVHISKGDGFYGLADHAPYDAIYVGAAAEYIPEELVKQLTNGGRMVIPIGPPGGFHNLVVVDVASDGTVSTQNLGVVRFVPLTSYEKQLEGEYTGPTLKIEGADGKPVLVRSQYFPAPDTTQAEIKIIRHQLKLSAELAAAKSSNGK